MAAAHAKIRFGGTQTPDGYMFELTGGRLCLDLANTKDERLTDHPRELLGSYREVVDWASQAGVLSADDAVRLRRLAAEKPEAAERARARLVSARELLFEVFSAIASRRTVPAAQLDALDALAAEAFGRRRLAESTPGFGWTWRASALPDPDRPLWSAAVSAANLLTSPALDRVRQCEGDGCAWLFLDTSKNASRRWCDMSVCGNRAKAKRHRGRQARPRQGAS